MTGSSSKHEAKIAEMTALLQELAESNAHLPEPEWTKTCIYRHTNGIGINVPRTPESFTRALQSLEGAIRRHERLKLRQTPTEDVRDWAVNRDLHSESSEFGDNDYKFYCELWADRTQGTIDAYVGMFHHLFETRQGGDAE